MRYIKASVSRARTSLSIFAAIMLMGFASYISIPVELNPDVSVPVIVTTIIHEGISPEDAERLLSKPMEVELKTLEGLTQVSSFSSEGAATVITEFDVSFDSSQALNDVRTAIDRAKANHQKFMAKGVEKGKITQGDMDPAPQGGSWPGQ